LAAPTVCRNGFSDVNFCSFHSATNLATIRRVIRRYTGSEFLLFMQAEHSALTERLAGRTGGRHITPPADRSVLARSMSLHDAGWDEFDAPPRLSPQRYPLDQAEAAWQTSLSALRGSTLRGIDAGDDVAFRVSVFGLHQSYDAGRPTEGPLRFDPNDLRKKFEVNKYQHAEIELQEVIRIRKEMRIDSPRRLGLAMEYSDPAERQLAVDVRLMQLIDWIAVAAMARELPASPLMPVLDHAGNWVTPLLALADPERVRVAPWPFDVGEIVETIRFRRYPAVPTRSLPEFQHAFPQIPVESMQIAVLPSAS
jgi:hypothetical protein